MAKREGAGRVPPPPLRVRVHREAAAQDGRYAELGRRLEAIGWFQRALLDLGGLARAAAESERAARELGLEPVEAEGVRFMRATIDGLCVMFWISEASSTVYVLHSLRASLYARVSSSANLVAARRCAACLIQDTQRAATKPASRSKRTEAKE